MKIQNNKNIFCFIKSVYLCIAIKGKGPVAQLNRASDYGSEGYRFESCRGHKKKSQAAG